MRVTASARSRKDPAEVSHASSSVVPVVTDPTGSDVPATAPEPTIEPSNPTGAGRAFRPLRGVVIGAVVTLLGAATVLFTWLAWLLSGAPAPWRDGWVRWLGHVQGADWQAAAVSALGFVGVVVLAVQVVVAVRRQTAVEWAHDLQLQRLAIAAERQRVSATQAWLVGQRLDVDRERLEQERQRLDLETSLHHDDRERDLRLRFTAAAQLLGDARLSARLAGARALAALADDWHVFGVDAERRACIELLCDQVRYVPHGTSGESDVEFRKAVVSVIREHRRRPTGAHSSPVHGDGSWAGCRLDLTGAQIPGAGLLETDLREVVLTNADLSNATLTSCDLRGGALANVRFVGANLVSADLTGADLRRADLSGCWLVTANLTRADLTEAVLNGAVLGKATLAGANLSGADLSGADLSGASLDGAVFDAKTVWPNGFEPPSWLKAVNNIA